MCLLKAVADPGFPIGGAWNHKGGCGPPTRALFGENVCKNERNARSLCHVWHLHEIDFKSSIENGTFNCVLLII